MKHLNILFATLLMGACLIAQADTGFIVAAPDRGFIGNEQVREAVAQFRQEAPTRLVFVTHENTAERLSHARRELLDAGADPIILMPLYLTSAHPDRNILARWRESAAAGSGRPFGRSYLAVKSLQTHLQAISHSNSHFKETRLILLGHGAKTDEQAKAMEAELEDLLQVAAKGFGFAGLEAMVWADVNNMQRDARQARLAKLKKPNTVLLPFHLGPYLDSMMSFTAGIQRLAPEGLPILDGGISQQAIYRWLAREAIRYSNLEPEDVGVIVHAHGANWRWNETMREGAQPLADTHTLAYAFSMGDPVTLRDAVRELETSGVKAGVIVRVFSMEDSFRDGIVQFIGQAWEGCEVPKPESHSGHHMGMDMTVAPRLGTALPVITVGGLENHPLYARALYQRALALSEDPARETVILVAHGLGTEKGNARWHKVLDSIRKQILELGGDRFRAIEIALWSEDWPELRQSAIEHVRDMVRKANENNGRVLIVPARTLGQGHAKEYLDGLEFVLGEGFAPHPLFAEWLATQTKEGIDRLTYDQPDDWRCSTMHHDKH